MERSRSSVLSQTRGASPDPAVGTLEVGVGWDEPPPPSQPPSFKLNPRVGPKVLSPATRPLLLEICACSSGDEGSGKDLALSYGLRRCATSALCISAYIRSCHTKGQVNNAFYGWGCLDGVCSPWQESSRLCTPAFSLQRCLWSPGPRTPILFRH